DARVDQRCGLVDGRGIVIEQSFRMGHQHVGGEAAVDGDAEKALLDAEVLVAIGAVAALAAADPGEYRLLLSDQRPGGIGTYFVDDTSDFVPERKRQRHAARGVEPLAAAE